jgi:glycosyltransferase involved in cell wall biosynthesis
MKILFLINNPAFFLSHRLPLAVGAREAGFEVHVAAPAGEGAEVIRRHGFEFHALPLDRSRGRLWSELRSIAAIHALYKRVRPDIVHHVTIKPVIYGSLAARWSGVPGVVNALSGLGHVFISRGPWAAARRFLVCLLYRFALRLPRHTVIFQNPDDIALFLRSGLVRGEDVVLIRGSGVDTSLYMPLPEKSGPPVVMFPSRLLWEKGLAEFVAAAERLGKRGLRARFALVGRPDPGNPASASEEWLKAAADRGTVELWGHRKDMHAVLNEAHVVCLPSYREGLPKVLIEAAACGRAIVTTDVPGCREVVADGGNGLLVPERDDRALADAIETLVLDADLRQALGSRGRERAIGEFSERRVVEDTLKVYARFSGLPARAKAVSEPSGFVATEEIIP